MCCPGKFSVSGSLADDCLCKVWKTSAQDFSARVDSVALAICGSVELVVQKTSPSSRIQLV